MRAVVGDDTVGDPKAANNPMDEVDHGVGGDRDDKNNFHPLSEFIDGDVDVLVPSYCSGEGSQDVQPPYRERLRERDGLEGLCWLVHLFGVELACLAAPDQLRRILQSSGPIETLAESLTDQHSRCRVVSALPLVDVREHPAALLSGGALEQDLVGASSVQLPIPEGVVLRLSSDPFCHRVTFWEDIILQVAPNLRDPWGFLSTVGDFGVFTGGLLMLGTPCEMGQNRTPSPEPLS